MARPLFRLSISLAAFFFTLPSCILCRYMWDEKVSLIFNKCRQWRTRAVQSKETVVRLIFPLNLHETLLHTKELLHCTFRLQCHPGADLHLGRHWIPQAALAIPDRVGEHDYHNSNRVGEHDYHHIHRHLHCVATACRNEYYKMCPECYNQKVGLSTTKPALSTTAMKKWK